MGILGSINKVYDEYFLKAELGTGCCMGRMRESVN
jgi:hypothetical protein